MTDHIEYRAHRIRKWAPRFMGWTVRKYWMGSRPKVNLTMILVNATLIMLLF